MRQGCQHTDMQQLPRTSSDGEPANVKRASFGSCATARIPSRIRSLQNRTCPAVRNDEFTHARGQSKINSRYALPTPMCYMTGQ